MRTVRRANFLLASCAIGAAGFDPAVAQGTGQAQRDALGKAATKRGTTEEIVVTAQRRTQRLVDVPASVSAISGATLARSGVKSVLDLGQVSTGVNVQRQGGFVQPAIRGISTLTTGIGFENNVALYIDGFYQADTTSLSAGMAGLADIEVLKGPQGTLYGRNATGGAILINTREPSKVWTGDFSASYARFNDHIAQGYISGPIGNGDLATFNVSAYNRYSNGYIRYTLGQVGNAAPLASNNVRAKLKLTPNNDITVTFGYNHTYLNDPFGLTFVYPQYSPVPPDLHATQPDTATENVPSKDSVTVNGVTMKTVVNLPFGVLTSRTGYDHRSTKEQYDYDGTLVPIVNVAEAPAIQETFQQALDIQVTAIRNVDLLFGGSFYDDSVNIRDSAAVVLGTPLSSSTSLLKSSAGAIYGSGTYHLGALSFTAGLRGNIERRTLSYYQTSINGSATVTPGRAGKTFAGLTPSATIAYALSHRTSVYASYSTGYRSGVFQPSPVPEPSEIVPIKPERITAFEVGAKTSQSFWTLNAAAFYYIFRDLQVGVQEPDPVNPGGGVIEAIINAHKATTYGVELEGTVRPSEGWAVNGGMAVLHARYDKFPNAIGVGLDPASQSEVTPQFQNWNGQEAVRAPTFTANLGTNYNFGLFGGQMTLTGNGSFTTSFSPNDASIFGPLAGADANKQRYRTGAYALLNANISWADPTDHYSIGVFATNLTNTHYLIVYNGSAFGDSKAYGQPAQYGVRLGYKF